MVGTGIVSNNMRYHSPECYTPNWRMTIHRDILHWSDITPILTILLIWTLLPNSTFYLLVITRGFNRTFATGAACQQRTLAPPNTWSCPTLELASVLIETILSWTCLVSGLLSFEYPLVLFFCSRLHVPLGTYGPPTEILSSWNT